MTRINDAIFVPAPLHVPQAIIHNAVMESHCFFITPDSQTFLPRISSILSSFVVFCPEYFIIQPSIRPRYSPGLPLRTPFFCNYLQKTVHFYTIFSNKRFPWDSGQTGEYPSSYKTLMYAIGRQNS